MDFVIAYHDIMHMQTAAYNDFEDDAQTEGRTSDVNTHNHLSYLFDFDCTTKQTSLYIVQ